MADMQLGYIANIIMQGFEGQNHNGVYLEEKRRDLMELDKFRSLLFLNNCDTAIQEHVANTVGVTLNDLRTTIKVLSHF